MKQEEAREHLMSGDLATQKKVLLALEKWECEAETMSANDLLDALVLSAKWKDEWDIHQAINNQASVTFAKIREVLLSRLK